MYMYMCVYTHICMYRLCMHIYYISSPFCRTYEEIQRLAPSETLLNSMDRIYLYLSICIYICICIYMYRVCMYIVYECIYITSRRLCIRRRSSGSRPAKPRSIP